MTSVSEVRIYDTLKVANRWLPASELGTRVGLHPRSAAGVCKRLVAAGLVEEVRLFPASHWRLRTVPSPAGKEYLSVLDRIREVMKSAPAKGGRPRELRPGGGT